MSVRRLIVEISLEGLNVREFCRCHGVSTWFFYDLRRRYRLEGEAVLEPRSRAARRVANRTGVEVEEMIVTLRKQLGEQGLDCGPATIYCHLGEVLADGAVPSEATIWRVLGRRGFIVAQPHKAPKGAHRRFVAARANECWQIDDTSWALADGRPVKVIDVIDDCSRVAVASQAVITAASSETALAAILTGAASWGLPERILADNGPPYGDTLTAALGELGVAVAHSRVYHPQTCGKVERFHQTLKRWLGRQPPTRTLHQLQDQLDTFCAIYNHRRPHRALARRFPAQVWSETPKSGPAAGPLTTATTIHFATVAPSGRVSAGQLPNQPGRRPQTVLIGIGNRYAGKPAAIVTTANTCHVFVQGRLARKLTLDLTRRYQPRLRSNKTHV